MDIVRIDREQFAEAVCEALDSYAQYYDSPSVVVVRPDEEIVAEIAGRLVAGCLASDQELGFDIDPSNAIKYARRILAEARRQCAGDKAADGTEGA